MKYSQPILFACVGGAAIVSAMPTLADSSADLSARTLPPSTVPHKSKSTKVGTRLGKLIKYGGAFAQQANPNRMEYSPRGLLSSVAKASSKQKVRKATSSLKRTGKAAIAAAGGRQAVAESLGSMLLGRANSPDTTSDSTTPVTTAPKPRKTKPRYNNGAKKPYSEPLKKPVHASEAREFQEALEERGTGGLGRALMAARGAKASSSSTSVEPAHVTRDIFDGDDLAERDFEEIDVRDFEINEID
ncbi:hypothetical protein Hypma_001192 [Hypsizygus marmoreus]|uniref:Uncharacterized protein n=1 Tax=Hypsizygus marmoreus TaxID=39966 RepID=A0A369J6J7_HYPMA|nr:hypothetical protein Hypma_001192 [Hypsizygus marmoreus]